ncbi:hypothetical protein GCM10027346_42250 [Hymenobacter seoulensis]
MAAKSMACCGLAAHIDAAQPILVQQVAKHGFDRALAHPAHVLPLPAALPVPGPTIRGIECGAIQLLVVGGGHPVRFARAVLAILIVGPIVF